MIYVETFKEEAYSVKLRVTLIRDLGNGLNQFNAYLTNLVTFKNGNKLI